MSRLTCRTAWTRPDRRRVRKVDDKKITLPRGPLKRLDMPGTTVVLGVKDDAERDKVQTGEKVRFQAEKIDGKSVVTAIEGAR